VKDQRKENTKRRGRKWIAVEGHMGGSGLIHILHSHSHVGITSKCSLISIRHEIVILEHSEEFHVDNNAQKALSTVSAGSGIL
jgi:hypothetical protein